MSHYGWDPLLYQEGLTWNKIAGYRDDGKAVYSGRGRREGSRGRMRQQIGAP